MTRVVNIRDVKDWTPDHVYIGRRARWRKRALPRSVFANPYHMGPGVDRAEVIEQYRLRLSRMPGLAERALAELTGKILVCWCSPEACHGDALALLCDGDGSMPGD